MKLRDLRSCPEPSVCFGQSCQNSINLSTIQSLAVADLIVSEQVYLLPVEIGEWFEALHF